MQPWATGWRRNFPHLYGSSCDKYNSCVTDLTNCTNSQVASFYQNLVQQTNTTLRPDHGRRPWRATPPTNSLAGNYAQSYGFSSSTAATA